MINFKLTSKAMPKIKFAYLITHYVSSKQSTIYLEGHHYIIINPPTLSGDYLLSVRTYKDGRRNVIVGELQ